MALTSVKGGFVALRRFGFGARPGEAAYLRADPRGAVAAQLDPDAALLAGDLGATPAINREIWDLHEAEKKAREAKAPVVAAAPAGAAGPGAPQNMASPGMSSQGVASQGMTSGGMAPGGMAPAMMGAVGQGMAATKPGPRAPQRHYMAELSARLDRQITTDTPFVERLVNFWSNHFCVSAAKSDHLRGTAGAYEREAIRPHVLGRFADMLTASTHHPAMLQYLDNQLSVGPTSKAGLREKKGLNENLAREIMELHTLGVDGGYSQADVTSFARILTGWTLAYRNDRQAEPGTAKFAPDRHEPGAHAVLGKTYPDVGAEQLDRALADFAVHPATARHVARKFARHFVGDAAPPELIATLETTFRTTGGDLAALARALVTADAAWTAPPAKVLAPWDFLVATGRTLGISWSFPEADRMLALFGQRLWEVPFPAGWHDDDDAWADPDSLLELLDAAYALARRNAGDRDSLTLGRAVLGPLLGDATQAAIGRAGSREEALALLVMSPEFLRR